MKDQANTGKNQKIRILHYQRNVDWRARILISCLKMRDLDVRRLFAAEAATDEALEQQVEEKTSSALKELSEKTVELNKRNKYKPRLGPGGYKKKIPIWREQEAKLRAEGKPDPLPNTNEHTRNWVYGCSELTDEAEIIVKVPTIVEVVQALKGPIATQTEAGLFTPQYHKDELAEAIGTKEHGGRVRGVSSSATWKEGFSDTSSHLYKKHTLNRKEREDKAKEDWRRQLLMFAIDKESGRLDPNLQATMDAFLRGSSTSTQPSVSMQPSISGQPSVPMQSKTDNITEDTPCELHVPLGYKGKTMKVASGTTFLGEMLHNRDIPPGYVRVTVSEIVPGYEDNEIECPIPEAEPKNPKAKSDVDKYLAALKKRLASTGKLVLQEEDPRDVLSYDDQILENPADDLDYPKFILGKPLTSNNMYKNLPWEMRNLHDWYMMASKEGVTKITCRIPKEVFNEDDEQILYLFWEDIHSMFRLDQMDVTFITLWCM
ncbi:hypothetical protein QOZ80_8AG0628540 [Eleusine coracana subsp. coracana]|nr:hypothetical protein QOZ80_8AG0628540 [Eleusine coracana subsp. coracana]